MAVVSLVETIQSSVRVMADGVGRAGQEAAAAGDTAQQIAVRAAASGFVGIAQNMARVSAAIGEIQGSVNALSESVHETSAVVATAPRQPSPHDTIAAFTPLEEKLRGIHAGIGGCIERVERTKRLANSVLQGGQPGPMLTRLDAIRQVLTTVAQHASAAKEHTETALREARNTGSAGN